MSAGELVLEGVIPATALGRLVLAEAAAIGLDTPATLIGAAADDPGALAMAAIEAGRAVLIEPIARCDVDGLREVAGVAAHAGVVASAAFRRRFEPDLAWARSSVAAGSIGLPWGVHAEALAAAASDSLTEALDLLDAMTVAAGLHPIEVVRLGATRRGRGAGDGAPIVLSVGLDHGGVGQVIARTAMRGDDDAAGPELASFRITGSHGTIIGDLDGPALGRHPDRPDAAGSVPARVDADGTRRMLDAFRAAVASGPGDPGSALVGLRASADLLSLIGTPTRAGRRT